MNATKQDTSVIGIPKQAFEQFLNALQEKDVSSDVVNRLREALVEKGDVSEAVIKAALFGDTET